jgi:hypothetical protein
LLQPAGQGKNADQQFVLSVAFSPDGEKLACGCMDGSVCVFDVDTKQVTAELAGHFKPVRSVVFTPGASIIPSPRQTFFVEKRKGKYYHSNCKPSATSRPIEPLRCQDFVFALSHFKPFRRPSSKRFVYRVCGTCNKYENKLKK